MKILDSWFSDMPQQFKGKRNIEALIKAFARQMEEVEQALSDINELTNIDTATGQNLDYIGTIVSLTRVEAQRIIRASSVESITDEVYRKVIKYQILKNNCLCTYEDIMYSAELIWDADLIKYEERQEHPATIFLKLPAVSIDEPDPALNRALPIKPAGVAMTFATKYHQAFNISGLEQANLPRIFLRTAIPFWTCRLWDGTWPLDGSYLLNSQYQPYTMHLIIKGIRAGIREHIENAPVAFRVQVSSGGERTSSQRIRLRSELSFWGHRYFNGTWYLDGSTLLDTAYPLYPLYQTDLIVGRIQAQHVERFDNAEVETRHNLWYLDGGYALDGSMVMDADIWKEAI